jgi:hypothetical protein
VLDAIVWIAQKVTDKHAARHRRLGFLLFVTHVGEDTHLAVVHVHSAPGATSDFVCGADDAALGVKLNVCRGAKLQ